LFPLTQAKLNPLFAPGFDGYNVSSYPNTLIAKAYWGICGFNLMFVMNNIVQPFNFGSLERSHDALMSFNYFGHILLVAVYIVLELLPAQKKKIEAKKE
jgi:hypothetical protein